MRLDFMRCLEENQHHYYWRSHAYCISKTYPSPLPADIVYLILRLVPTFSYLHAYRDEVPFDCELQHDPWGFPDIDAPKAFGDY